MTAFWLGLDNMITFSNRKHTEAVIWQTIDDDDTAFLADGMLRVGTKNKAAAAAIRGIANSSVMLRTGMIMLPRFIQSVQFYSANGGLYLGGF